MPLAASTASASLTGPDTVRQNDTITVTFNLNGSGIFGVSGTLSYDSYPAAADRASVPASS